MWKRRTRREVVVIVVVLVVVVEMMVAGFGRRLEEVFVDGLLSKCRTPKKYTRDGELINQELMTLWYQ